MEAVIDLLLAWIGENSQYDTSHLARPQVVELSAEDLTTRYYEGMAHKSKQNDAPADGVEDRLNALYIGGEDEAGTVYIRPAATIEGAQYFENPYDNPLWREILMHELVHHAQHAAQGTAWTCVARGEAEAYHMGGLFFAQKHWPDPMQNREIWKVLYHDC